MSTMLKVVSGDAIVRRLAALAGVLGLLLAGLAALPGSAAATTSAPAYSHTSKLTRSYYTASGDPTTASNTVTVTADKTTNLQTRERINISWSGAHPTGGRALNPYGINGVSQEYPVMIMECRGLDDASLPADQRLSPNTCWTSTWNQRTTQSDPSSATWLFDSQGADPVTDPTQASASITGVDPTTVGDGTNCPTSSSFAYRITPFISAPTSSDANEKTYNECNDASMPPSASNNAGEPTNEIYAYTGSDGSGSAEFEVRTKIENEALGCSQTVRCSVVVIPMMGIDCASAADPCNGTGSFQPGSLNTDNSTPDAALSPLYWWSSSNWDRRFSIPLTFAPSPDTCSVNGSGTAVPFYGSELLNQAALQWAPAYCLNKSRFNWQANSMPDEAATKLVLNGGAVASQPAGRIDGDEALAYGPTALTGWGIAFNIDKPDGSLDTSLKLNATLLAKLLTESYPGSNLVKRDHTDAKGQLDLDDNPLSINLDPEFQQLNPGLNQVAFTEAASTLLALSTSSAVMESLTSYIAADPAAMAWLNGKPDRWGMKVNSYYKGLALPVSTWPLMDQWVPSKTGVSCLDANPSPYMQKIAAPVSSFSLIARAMLLSWPNVSTLCALDSTSNTWNMGRIQQQGIGRRMQFGLVSLGDAARYGLTVASLQASPGHYVAADTAGIDAAVKLMKQPKADKPFTLTQATVRKSATAYPGTQIVYTAAKASGLAQASAGQVAQFIRVSSTEGQISGRGNGQLPAGFVPIVDSGTTKRLYVAAQQAAAAIKRQKGVPGDGTKISTGASTPSAAPSAAAGTGDAVASPPLTQATPATATTAPSGSSSPSSTTSTTEAAKTVMVSSSLGGGTLPLLLTGAIAALLASLILRVVLLMRRAQ